ncbi:hypothetical protein [Streptomyces sp. NBC_00151]|uniref:hypothetical protein n=1 Tax=Streptomyces sp. NBC_00151 TaxID=2975669 RepID=UPI003FA3649B
MLRDPGPAWSGPKGGRPRRHGGVLAFARPDTWQTPTLPPPPAMARPPQRRLGRMDPRLTPPWPLTGTREGRTPRAPGRVGAAERRAAAAATATRNRSGLWR